MARPKQDLSRQAAWLVALVVVVIDQLTKDWAITNLGGAGSQPLLPGLLNLQLVFNTGAAFTLPLSITTQGTTAITVTGNDFATGAFKLDTTSNPLSISARGIDLTGGTLNASGTTTTLTTTPPAASARSAATRLAGLPQTLTSVMPSRASSSPAAAARS
jgi:hypothetical protein